ncbi:histidinol dehydrogenase [Puccinia sorghi]|uniref:Histidinol dehydrogenase n=1 Tax=Puccinia sorghi TaxID=27349 RepID=A0A0L6VG42_9BASI|nr:histidinol dehydrogenase [Puccinia sorghi]
MHLIGYTKLAQVVQCERISVTTPVRADGKILAEIMYIVRNCGLLFNK